MPSVLHTDCLARSSCAGNRRCGAAGTRILSSLGTAPTRPPRSRPEHTGMIERNGSQWQFSQTRRTPSLHWELRSSPS